MLKSVVLLTLMLGSLAFADSRVGNGDGGLKVDGNYLTFPETGAQIEGRRLLQIPELIQLNQVLTKLQINPGVFQGMLPSLYPSLQRSYYRVSAVDPVAMEQIRKIYGRLYKVTPENVVVYAVTDADTQKTFLLPDFFKLNDLQKSGVLFHEWIWAANPDITYEDVVVGDQLFWNFQQEPQKYYYELSLYLAQVFKNPDVLLGPVFSRSSDFTADLLTPEFAQCLSHIRAISAADRLAGAQNCLSQQIQSFAALGQATDVQKVLLQYSVMGRSVEYSGDILTQGFKDLHVQFIFNANLPRLEICDEKNSPLVTIYFRK